MSISPIPIAIVGLGGVADSHISAYRDLSEIDIVAVVDPRQDRMSEVAARLGAQGFPDSATMLRSLRPKLACVLSTVASHRSITEMLAAAEVHVLCEKPIANRIEDAIAMRDVCVRHGVEFMYGSSYRFLPAVLKARELIASGVIGAVRLVEERGVIGAGAAQFTPLSSAHYPEGTPGGGGFGLFDHGIHLLDIIPWLVGSPVRRVMGRGNYTGRPAEPEFAVLEHENGTLGMLTYDESTVPSEFPWEGMFSRGRNWKVGRGFAGDTGEWTQPASFIRIHGTHGALRLYHYGSRLFLCSPGEVKEIEVHGEAVPQHFGRQLLAFIEAIEESRSAPLPADIGIDALKILLAIYESARTSNWTSVE
jgi:UDP-N-acetyl-2-amino-2-deoxyglucuronate dehydrogenase